MVRISPSCSALILCKGKRELVIEYTLRNLATPMGIAEFRHLEKLPAELKGSLPSIGRNWDLTRRTGNEGDQATASRPLCLTRERSFKDAPEGFFSPRSHLLIRLVVTFR